MDRLTRTGAFCSVGYAITVCIRFNGLVKIPPGFAEGWVINAGFFAVCQPSLIQSAANHAAVVLANACLVALYLQ
jgi:hypothetical protein